MIEFDLEDIKQKIAPQSRIKVLGIGGGGGNMVNSMIESGFENVSFIVANTDAQALKISKANHKVQLGVKSTRGLGAGANPEVGRKSAEEDLDLIIDNLKDSDIVFLTAGLGGGTGSGALPVIAKALRDKDILTVAVVTKPFSFEGKRRMRIAQESLDLLKKEVDTIIVLQNQKLIDTMEPNVSLIQAFSKANEVLSQFIRAISDIINKHGQINVDFADIKSIMKQKGFALIGIGHASGIDRAIKAATQAISSPLLENVELSRAKGLLFNITGPSDLGLHELSQAASLVYKKAHDDANIVVGSVIDDNLNEEVFVTVIATGFSDAETENTLDTLNKSSNKIEHEFSKNFDYSFDNNNSKKSDIKIDLEDLDIPTVMRKVIKESQF